MNTNLIDFTCLILPNILFQQSVLDSFLNQKALLIVLHTNLSL